MSSSVRAWPRHRIMPTDCWPATCFPGKRVVAHRPRGAVKHRSFRPHRASTTCFFTKKEIHLFLIKENESRTRAGLIIIWFLLILRNNALRLVSKTNESWATWGWELLAFSKESVLRARGVASVMQIQMMPTARTMMMMRLVIMVMTPMKMKRVGRRGGARPGSRLGRDRRQWFVHDHLETFKFASRFCLSQTKSG